VIERAVELATTSSGKIGLSTIQTVTSQEAADLPLRKEPSRGGD